MSDFPGDKPLSIPPNPLVRDYTTDTLQNLFNCISNLELFIESEGANLTPHSAHGVVLALQGVGEALAYEAKRLKATQGQGNER